MGKWAKGHLKPRNALNPLAGMRDLTGRLKDDMSPDVPGETAEERALRDRQATQLAKLDDEENRRIKSMFAAGGARKLFRAARTGRSAGASSAASSAPASGPGSPQGGRPVFGGGRSLIR